MIRLLLGSALPVLGIGAAAVFLGPDLLTGPRGEPLILAAPDQPNLQAASFDGDACASTLIFSALSGEAVYGARVFAFTLPAGGDDVAVAVEDYPGDIAVPRTVVLVFDEEGQLIAAGDPASLQLRAAAALADCVAAPKTDSHTPI